MTKEFKVYSNKNETRYVLETMTAGATGSANVATAPQDTKLVQSRNMEATDKVPQKPRQGHLRPQTGGGKHRDKKKEQKKGQEKHRKPFMEDGANALKQKLIAHLKKANPELETNYLELASMDELRQMINDLPSKDMKEGHTDHEISMSRSELYTIAKQAMELFKLLSNRSEMEGLEAWQQSKITKAADYLNAVSRSLNYDEMYGDDDKFGVAEQGGVRYHQVYGDPGENTKDEIYLVKKHYFKVPFDQKDSAKQIGLRWDPDVKTWYLPEYSVAGKRFESRLMAAKSVFGDEIKVASEEGAAEGFDNDPTGPATWNGHRVVANRRTPKGDFLILQNKNDGKYEIHKQNPGVVGGLEFVSVHKTPDEMQSAFKKLTGIDESKKGVAEDFTDDLDNIYAMHPQPEKSEQVVFLITGMTEDEFSNRWTDLPDPYQQEFGYDLPLWDADDLSSYPNLAVKRITFDQYVQLVGNYIKSEELAGSTMSRMKRGVVEGNNIKISLKVNNEDSTVDVTAMLDGEEVGHVNFDDSEGELIPQDLYVDPEYRGQGIAAAMYDYTKSKGYTILQGEEQSDDAVGFWAKHRPGKKVWEQGVAEGLAPGQAAWKKEMIAKGAVSFQRDQHGGGAVDRIVAYSKDGRVVGGFNRKGVAEGDFDKWGGEIKTPNPDRKKFRQPTSPAKLAQQQAADRQRKKSAKESEMAEEKIKGADGKACWKGKRYAGTKNGKDICIPVGEEETNESGLLAWAGRRKHGADYMKKASAAARKGASQEELGRLKDKYSKAEKVKEAEKKGLYYYVNKRKKAGTSRPASHPDAPSAQDWKNAAKTAKTEDVYINQLYATLNEKMQSQQQSKLMHAAANDPAVAEKTGVSQEVAREFVKASHGQKVSKLPKRVKKDK